MPRARLVEVILVAQGAKVLALLALLVGVEARLLELVVRDGVFHAMHDELDALLDLGEFFGQRGLAQLHAGAGLVDEVDGLVRKEAVRDVAAGVRDREGDRVVGVADGVELLVLLADAHDDLDRVFFVRRRNLDGLEAALERAVLLDGLAILRRRGGSDALDLATAEGRLEDVGGIERTFGRACADERVQLIDEDDGVLVLHQLLHDGLQALFKLAAILGASDDQRKVERKDALVGEEARHFAVGDLLREAFDDGGLADAGLADEHRIVLGAAAEDLDDALDLEVAADQRIELLVHRAWVRSRENSASMDCSCWLPRCPATAGFARQAFSCVVRCSSSRMAGGADRARSGSPRRSTFLRAAGRAADARCRCACARAARLLRPRRRARACTRWRAEGRPRSRPSRARWCAAQSVCGWIRPTRASAESGW
jgi:hypothetical protein